jgi:hypothetical protein
MPYDPNFPPHGVGLVSQDWRDQFNALKALIDAQAALLTSLQAQIATLAAQLAALANLVPIGAVLPWFKDLPGVPPLPENFVECNGQFLADPQSPLDGQLMPDINTGAQRFIRGGVNSGAVGGIDSFGTAQADNSGTQPVNNFVTTDFSPGAQPFPPFVTAVYVIRVK